MAETTLLDRRRRHLEALDVADRVGVERPGGSGRGDEGSGEGGSDGEDGELHGVDE